MSKKKTKTARRNPLEDSGEEEEVTSEGSDEENDARNEEDENATVALLAELAAMTLEEMTNPANVAKISAIFVKLSVMGGSAAWKMAAEESVAGSLVIAVSIAASAVVAERYPDDFIPMNGFPTNQADYLHGKRFDPKLPFFYRKPLHK